MKRINPFLREKPYLLLTSIYPFVIGNSEKAFKEARVILKIACLLNEQNTVPGSLSIESNFVRRLLLSNDDFIKEGNLILDLRSSCNSFSELLKEKAGLIDIHDVRIAANHFDKICKTTISFNAPETSNQLKGNIKYYLNYFISKAKKQEVKDTLHKSLEEIDSVKGFLSLEMAKKILEGSYLSTRLKNIATMLYCKAGADVTNSLPLLTNNIWEASFIRHKTEPETNQNYNLRNIANASVLEFFAIRNDAIDKLEPKEIIDIRNEPLTSQYINELDAVIKESKKIIEEQEEPIAKKYSKQLKDLSVAIQNRIYEKCKQERKRVSKEAKVIHTIEEVAGLVIPFIGTAKKGITSLSQTIAKKYDIAWLDYSTTPLSTYVAKYRDKVIG